MAKSPSHRLGQMIGDLLEETVIRYCKPIANEYKMYIDFKHSRPARKNQNDVRWTDMNGNTHKLDIVIESNGSEQTIGQPRAFIEVAWRRYTKHSKNKVQEISAAVKPLVSRYREHSPFYGAVLAGEFTQSSLNQMKSEGFQLLYFSSNAVEKAFASQGINVHWEEDTSEQELEERIKELESLSELERNAIGDKLMSDNDKQWKTFLTGLKNALSRRIEHICIVSLYGNLKMFDTVEEACNYIAADITDITFNKDSFYAYQIFIKYSNGDKIEMQFKEQQAALASLRCIP